MDHRTPTIGYDTILDIDDDDDSIGDDAPKRSVMHVENYYHVSMFD